MKKEESLKILQKCLDEIESMSQEEFDRRDEMVVEKLKYSKKNVNDECTNEFIIFM